MIIAYLTGALVMAWHFWSRRARVRPGLRWLSPSTLFDIAFWPWTILASLLTL